MKPLTNSFVNGGHRRNPAYGAAATMRAMPTTDDAAALLGEAWALRREALGAPPDTAEGSRVLAERVRAGIAEAAAVFRGAGAHAELADALGKLGHVERDAGRREAARSCFAGAVAAARAAGDPLGLAHAVRQLGDVHRQAGRLAPAEACYDEALTLYRQSGPGTAVLAHANALRPMAILKEAQGRVGEARALWKHARALYREAGIEAGVAECVDRLRRLA